MTFTDEQIKEIENLAGINYTVRQIAMYFDISAAMLQREYENPDSIFRYHYDRGRLVSQAKIDMALQESAEKQSLSAIQQLERVRQNRRFENQRDQLIYGDS
ncbi:MAG: hypothetical protein PHG67_14275 [Bacteroidales bacterium]|nr:hypothetical protein [Bacteroidales bacterium]